MIKNNLIVLLIAIGLMAIISGCTGGQDVTSVVKALPEVQQFMNEHPNAKITVTYWSKEEVTQSLQEISQQCDKPMTPVAMYKATVNEGDLNIISWINAENQIAVCSITQGSGEALPKSTPKSDPQTNKLKIINLNAQQIVLTDTEIKEIVGTDFTKKTQQIMPEKDENGIHILSGISVVYGNYNISIMLAVASTIDSADKFNQYFGAYYQKTFKVIVNNIDIGDKSELYSIVGLQNEKTTSNIGGTYIIFRKNNIAVSISTTSDIEIETLLNLARKQDEKISKLLDIISTTQGSDSTQIETPTPIQTSISTSAPTVSIVASNNPDTSGADLKIQHKGGDTLKGGEWKLSIVAVGQRPLFKVSNSDLSVGSQIIATTTTCDNAIITRQSVSGCSALSSQTKYDVKLVHIPSNAMLLDQVVEVRGDIISSQITPTPIQTSTSTTAPTASIVASNNPDTQGADLKIMHKGGDTLKAGEWKLSIIDALSPERPLFKVSNNDLSIGGLIIATTTTCDAAIVTDKSVTGCSALSLGGKYDVKLIHIPSNAMLLDQVIEVR